MRFNRSDAKLPQVVIEVQVSASLPLPLGLTHLRILDSCYSHPRLLIGSTENYPITRTVDNHIAKLSQKIETVPADAQYIITIHRVGYRFVDSQAAPGDNRGRE